MESYNQKQVQNVPILKHTNKFLDDDDDIEDCQKYFNKEFVDKCKS